MGFTDIFKGKQYKAELEQLSQEHNNLKELLTPELQDALNLKNEIDRINKEKEQLLNEVTSLNHIIDSKNNEISKLDDLIITKKKDIINMDDEILVQEFGLYQPKYEMLYADDYKDRLKAIRDEQKFMIKNKTATTGNTNWTVNGSVSQGRKMVADMQKLLLRAFNSECDELINKVKYNNFDVSKKRITSSKDAISKLGKIMDIEISWKYYQSKIDELHLALEYQIKKQEEKEAQREARAQMREAARLQKELEEQRKKIEKEQAHYQRALLAVLRQLENCPEDERSDLQNKKSELEKELGIIESSLKDLDYREANQRAGYVYIISNIGAFGENIYKIGMTRRLDPQERIDELGDASVPFKFDVHAMIFSDDAPKLENALHKAFENRKVNMVNQRREFFNVTLDEIKEVVRKNFDKTVEFIDVPEAEQYRISQKIKSSL